MKSKFFIPAIAYKKLFSCCILIVFLTACNNYLAKSLPDANQELIFDDLQWFPTSDPSIVSIDLNEFPNTVSVTNIISVKVNMNGYEIKVPYYSTPGKPYWYKIINNKIEVFYDIENDCCNLPMRRVTVIVTLKNNLVRY